MASIFKRGGRGAKGGWYIDYYERPGLRRRVYAGRDYESAKALARELERKALLRREGILDERAERWAEAESRPLADFLGDAPIEATTLARYCEWLRRRETESSPRSAQLARAHTLRVARWAASQGLVSNLPFERAPRPEAPEATRRPASVAEFAQVLESPTGPDGRRLAYPGGHRCQDFGGPRTA